jgi:hypothetical protein
MAERSAKGARLNLASVCTPARWNGDLSLPAPRLGPFLLSCRQKEDAMVRDPWIVAAALFAFGVIGWVVRAARPPKSPVRIEAARTLAAEPDLRLVSERNPYMRTER